MKPPKLKDAYKLTKRHSKLWNEFGLELEVSRNYREELRDRSTSNDDRLEAILYEWMQSENVPVTWSALLDALEEMKLRDLIRDIKEFLQTDKALKVYSSLPD